MNLFYSIIIPHHNIPELLQRLLKSIPRRNDTEIIIIDDNSDSTIVNFELFAGIERQDVKFLFDKKGGGGGYARNIGLKHATGKWVIFADADDFFNYCFNDVLNKYADSDADIIYFKANSVDTDNYTATFRTMHLNNYVDRCVNREGKGEEQLRYLFGEPWCKIIRRSIIEENKIRFDETSIHNDTTFSYLCGYHAKKIVADARAIYCVTSRNNSVSRQISESKKLERIDVFARADVFLRKHNVTVSVDKHFRQLYESKKENKNTYNKGLEIMKSHGIDSRVIKKQMFKQFWLHFFIRLLKCRFVIKAAESVASKCLSLSTFLKK